MVTKTRSAVLTPAPHLNYDHLNYNNLTTIPTLRSQCAGPQESAWEQFCAFIGRGTGVRGSHPRSSTPDGRPV
jgi:hypothetical protein